MVLIDLLQTAAAIGVLITLMSSLFSLKHQLRSRFRAH